MASGVPLNAAALLAPSSGGTYNTGNGATARIMKENNLDSYLIQETHLAGDFEKKLIYDYYLISK